jgi:shikimate kinase
LLFIAHRKEEAEVRSFSFALSVARCHAAISVVNSLATGFGGAIGVGIPCKVKAELISIDSEPSWKKGGERNIIFIESEVEDAHNLLRTCAIDAMNSLGFKLDRGKAISLLVDSSIPPAVGLKSSSALSVAVVSAISKLVARGDRRRLGLSKSEILRLSCNASKKSGASITGALDDAAACFLGGLVLTDNRRMKILKHSRFDSKEFGTSVVIRIPIGEEKLTSSIDANEVYSSFRRESRKAFELALQGEIAEAMTLNSVIQCEALGYSFSPIELAMKEGASAVGVSGKGPAIAAICAGEKIARRVERAWLDDEQGDGNSLRVIRTRIVQPEKG